MPIHFKEDLIVELALMHKYGIITVLLFPKYASPVFAQRKLNGKLRLLVDLRKINSLIAMTILTIIVQLALCQTQHNTWQEIHYSASLTASNLISVWRWRTKGQWKCLHSTLLAELLPTKDLHKVLADLCLLFQISCVSTWTQSSKLTNVLNL